MPRRRPRVPEALQPRPLHETHGRLPQVHHRALNSSIETPADPIEIQADHLAKSFAERVVLRDISLSIPRGSITAVVGGSGSGKTVLLHLLAGLIPPSSGRVLVADHSLPDAPLVELASLDEDRLDDVRRHWAVVFQRNALFSGTVYDNIRLLLREHSDLPEHEIRQRAREALAAVALDVDDVIDKDRDSLSGGMAKRVAIARAIALDPAVIFYDEPTTGLDPVVAAHIHDLVWTTHFAHTRSGIPRTSILVTHDKDLLRRMRPAVFMLHNGEAAFAGPYHDFEHAPDGPPHDYLRAMPVLHARPPER